MSKSISIPIVEKQNSKPRKTNGVEGWIEVISQQEARSFTIDIKAFACQN